MRNIAFVIMVGICSLAAQNVVATPKLPALTPGMSYHEVISLWGEPVEREEQETKRYDVWRYSGDTQVVFHEGKTVAWTGMPKPGAPVPAATPQKENGAAALRGPDGKVVDDLLSEILKDVPSLEDGPSGAPPSVPNQYSGVSVPPPVPVGGDEE